MNLQEASRQYQIAVENARSAREMADANVSFEDEAAQAEAELVVSKRILDRAYVDYMERAL